MKSAIMAIVASFVLLLSGCAGLHDVSMELTKSSDYSIHSRLDRIEKALHKHDGTLNQHHDTLLQHHDTLLEHHDTLLEHRDTVEAEPEEYGENG